jgi:hypothetical protein
MENNINMKQKLYFIRNLLSIIVLCISAQAMSQTVSSTNIITPVCASSNGEFQLNFANGATYPFTIHWNGQGVMSGTDTITSASQNITLTPSAQTYAGNGFKIYLYGPNQAYLGTYEVGMNFDLPNRYINVTCSGGAVFQVNNVRNGTAPYSLQLVNDTGGVVYSGASPMNIPFNTICPTSGKQLSIKVTDANGCTNLYGKGADSAIFVNCNGLIVTTSKTIASCTNGSATVTNVTGAQGPLSYAWSNGASSVSISGLRRGIYSCIVTDTTNCSGIGYANVEQSVQIFGNATTKSATCNNFDGEATVFATGGTGPYTYLWDNGSTTQNVTNLNTGYHTVVIEDANQCLGQGFAYINSVSPVNVTYTTTASSCTSNTGTASLSITGGQTPYTIVWHGKSSTTNSISNLPPGNQSFSVTDVNGCMFNGIVVIPQISTIDVKYNISEPICPNNNGSITINAKSSASGPLTYLWNTSATTPNLINLGNGSYSITITDTNSCQETKSFYLGTRSNIYLNKSVQNASCIFSANGGATAYAFGGTAPYSYSWSDGSSTQSISNKKAGIYFVHASDANGCLSNWNVKVVIGYDAKNDSCYCTIKGTVFDDLDSNCVLGNNEEGIYNAPIKIDGVGYVMTNYKGEYSVKVPAGTYNVTELPLYGSKFSSCQTNPQSVTFTTTGNACQQVMDFSNIIVPHHDIVTYPVIYNAPIPGRYYTPKIMISNNGNRNETNVDGTLFNDGKLSLSGVTPALTNLGNGFYEPINSVTLPKGKTKSYNFSFFTPTNLPLGAQVYFRDTFAYQSPISTYWITNEATPWNNINDYLVTVRSSYDPNQKNVYPQGDGADGIVPLSQKDFTYVVQFENNGTANADKVVIIDTLDSDFDIESFRTLDGSHKFTAFVSPTGVVTFTFDNINLAYTPKGVDNPLARGYIAYKIKAKSTVKIGDKLKNFADIYFDYNDPIRTNTTLNTYEKNTNINQVVTGKEGILLYPNPNSGSMQLLIPESFGDKTSLQVFNSQGQLVKTIANYESNSVVSTSDLSIGIYIVKVISGNGKVEYLRFIMQ